MEITKTITFDAAHRLPSHCGRCSNIHGHTFKLEVSVCSDVLVNKGSSEGMVIDYKDLKQRILDEVDSVFDHSLNLYYLDPYCKNMCGMYGIDYEKVNNLFGNKFSVYSDVNHRFNILNFIPTSENLACFIFCKLTEVLNVTVSKVVLYETPTSKASFTLDDYNKIGQCN